MSKKKKIFLWILIAFVVASLALAWCFKDTIKVVISGVTETPEQLQEKKENLDNKQKEALEQAGINNIRPLDETEKEELDKGNITKEEAIEIITGKATLDDIKQNKENEQTGQPKQPANESTPVDNSVNEKVAQLIGEIYVLEANFTSQLAGLEAWAINEYESVSKAEKPAKKKELAAIGFPKLAALEKECDGKVNAILSELAEVLKSSGQSVALVDQIRNAYEEKKIVTKSHYISEYM